MEKPMHHCPEIVEKKSQLHTFRRKGGEAHKAEKQDNFMDKSIEHFIAYFMPKIGWRRCKIFA